MTPTRLTLSRLKGFDLQALSIATNGLPAVNVARPTKWGNPFPTHDKNRVRIRSNAEAVAEFRELMGPQPSNVFRLYMTFGEIKGLRGKNLACWCKPGEPCHADVLLEIANRPICEEVT